MPRKKGYAKKSHRRRGVKTGAPLVRNHFTRSKRIQQNLTRDVRWFKEVRTITSNFAGNFRQVYSPANIINCDDWIKWASIWEEYKVLLVSVKFLPAAVGSESLQESTPPPAIPGPEATFRRGNVVTWVDQGELDTPVGPNLIQKLIVKPSARLIPPRRFHKRYVQRPYGNPEWGRLDDDGQVTLPDSWEDSRIQIFGENFTPLQGAGNQQYYYVMISYKVVFRGRQSTI